MPRIPYANIKESPQKIRDFFEKMGGDDAEIQNIFLMVGHSDISVREFIRLGNRLLTKPHLDPRLRELAILRIAQLAGARYEWAHHVTIAMGTGVTREQIKAIDAWEDSSLFSDEEKTVLRYTEEVFNNNEPGEDTFAAAAVFLDKPSLVELTLSIGYWSMVGKFLRTFQVDVEEKFLKEHAEIFEDVGMV